MKIGVIFPQTEIGSDPFAIRDFAQAAEGMGFNHILAYDHVLGAGAASYDTTVLPGPYREHHMFHEPFVLFGFLAGVTQRIGFGTSILILPQRQTVLVAKQAAEVDVLSGGRFRLGVGIGWNWVEYEALGVPFAHRGATQEEQIRLLRELWTQPLVSFEGRYHKVSEAGINPLPVQRPIPIWLGGMAEPVLKRVGTLADGWFPQFPSMSPTMVRTLPRNYEDPLVVVERVRAYAREAGRDPSTIGIEGRITYPKQTPDDWIRNFQILEQIGASHVSILTMGAGLSTAEGHIAALREVRDTLAPFMNLW